MWRSKDKALIEKYGLWLLRHDVDRALRVRRLFSSSSVFAALGRRKLTLPPCSTFRTALHRPKAARPARHARPVRQDGQGRLGRRRPVPRGHGPARARLGASLCTLSLSLRFVADSLSRTAPQDARLHADLVKRYIGRLGELLVDPEAKAHLREQGPSLPSSRLQHSMQNLVPTLEAHFVRRNCLRRARRVDLDLDHRPDPDLPLVPRVALLGLALERQRRQHCIAARPPRPRAPQGDPVPRPLDPVRRPERQGRPRGDRDQGHARPDAREGHRVRQGASTPALPRRRARGRAALPRTH